MGWPTFVLLLQSRSISPNLITGRSGKSNFEFYLSASCHDKESDKRQVSTLLYCLGDTADDVLTSTNISEDARKRYSDVLAKFGKFFKVRKNVIFERAKFNRCNQLPSESAENYIIVLYHLVDTCEYGELKEMLRNRLVVGMRDNALSKRLQMDAKLTLDKVKTELRQKKAAHQQQQLLTEPSTRTEALEAVEAHKQRSQRPRGRGGKVSTS